MGRGGNTNDKNDNIVVKRRRPSRPAPKPGECRPVLMSLQPKWSQAILDGQKTIELRRNRAGCEKDTPIVIYTSYPVRRIEGKCRVAKVTEAPLEELWNQSKGKCGCTKEEFYQYFQGTDKGFAISLCDVEKLPAQPIPFAGPQSYRYLFDDETPQQEILKLAGLL